MWVYKIQNRNMCFHNVHSTACAGYVVQEQIFFFFFAPCLSQNMSQNHRSAKPKVSCTHGRCSGSLSRTSWSSRRWNSPTAGCTRPCSRTSPPGRWYSGLERDRIQQNEEIGQACSQTTVNETAERIKRDPCRRNALCGPRRSKQCHHRRPDLEYHGQIKAEVTGFYQTSSMLFKQ